MKASKLATLAGISTILLVANSGLATAAEEKLKVFILAGQSNTVGHARGHTMATLFNADGPIDQALVELV